MHLRLLIFCALISLANFGCNGMGPEPTPAPPMNRDGGPHVDQAAPLAGGEVFDSNH